MKAAGQENIVNLLRCAWAGSQRYGALVWSGDIHSSFTSMRNQLAAGLNMGIAGIPWWTTDIGGFHGGNPDDPEFREVFVRWFQYGTFCPVMRPLFYDFSDDNTAWEIEDQYMFGPDILVAPVLYEDIKSRRVYLPEGAEWTNAWNGEIFKGGQIVEVETPIDVIPIFIRNDADIAIADR